MDSPGHVLAEHADVTFRCKKCPMDDEKNCYPDMTEIRRHCAQVCSLKVKPIVLFIIYFKKAVQLFCLVAVKFTYFYRIMTSEILHRNCQNMSSCLATSSA